MTRFHAAKDSAEMIERQFVGNRPQDQFVGETMGVDLLPSNPILTIADSCQPASATGGQILAVALYFIVWG